MSKKIIILEHLNQPSDNDYRYVFWLDVPVARQSFYANPLATSVYPGATADELTAIRSGAIVEQVGVIPRLSGSTLAQVAAALVAKFNIEQVLLTAVNQYDRYGTYWDGSTWTNITTA